MRATNPTLNEKTFSRARPGAGAMTIEGAVNRTGFLLFLVMVPAAWMWFRVLNAWDPSQAMGLAVIGMIGALVMALVTIFRAHWSPVTAPAYAVLEGLALGGVSAIVAGRNQAMVIQAIALTFGTLGILLVLYRTGIVRATENFKLGVISATGAIALVYIVSMVAGMFGTQVPYIHESGLIGIGFSVVVVVVAALNLVLDFDFIEQGERLGAPKYMEWYAAFGLVLTLVWLYLEILKLLAKLQGRSDD